MGWFRLGNWPVTWIGLVSDGFQVVFREFQCWFHAGSGLVPGWFRVGSGFGGSGLVPGWKIDLQPGSGLVPGWKISTHCDL